MPLRAETVARINRQAQSILDKEAARIAKDQRAKDEFEARKNKIREGLTELSQQITAGNAGLQHSLPVVLPKKDGYQTFYSKDREHSCTGLPISNTGNQIAVMTTTGIEILNRSFEHRRGRYQDRYTSYTETVFEPLDPIKANVAGLFPEEKFPVDKLPDAILDAVSQSPNKK